MLLAIIYTAIVGYFVYALCTGFSAISESRTESVTEVIEDVLDGRWK